jgi:hypothetical protein
LNPVEPLWSSLKGVELADLAGESLEEVIAAAERGIHRIRHHPPPCLLVSSLPRSVPVVSGDHLAAATGDPAS